MARKPSREAVVIELAEKLVRVLHAQRDLGADAYPLTVKRLVELTAPDAPPALVKKALNKRSFLREAQPAHAKSLDAPIALAADVDRLAASPLLLEFLLRQVRKDATHAFTVSKLKAGAAGKVQKPFQEAVNRQIAEDTLPPTVAWISVEGRKLLLLLGDLHTSGKPVPVKPPAASPPPVAAPTPVAQAVPAPAPVDFSAAFDEAFARLDRASGGHNFVNLIALRQALPVPREVFDRGLRQFRLAGRYALSAAEGRGGISPEERAAGISEEGSLLLFVSRSLS